jgi:hypothetical protein
MRSLGEVAMGLAAAAGAPAAGLSTALGGLPTLGGARRLGRDTRSHRHSPKVAFGLLDWPTRGRRSSLT